MIIHKKSTTTEWLLLALSTIACLYFYIDASMVEKESVNYRRLVYLDCISQWLTMMIFPTVIIFLKHLRGKESDSISVTLMYMPAIIMGSAAIVIYRTMGIENATAYISEFDRLGMNSPEYTGQIYELHKIVNKITYNCMMLAWMVVTTGYILATAKKNDFKMQDLGLFLFKGRESSPINIVSMLLIVFFALCAIRILSGRAFVMNHYVFSGILSIMLAIMLYLLFYICFYFSDTKVSLENIRDPFNRADLKQDKFLDIESGNDAVQKAEKSSSGSLVDRFDSYMTTEQPYLNPTLSIEDVAEALSSNRTYISVMMKEVYNMPFRAYINNLRIERAKTLLLQRPDDILDSIAADCGFASDSQLVKKFKEIEGESPKIWLKNKLED